MSSKKIWQYPEATSITNDDYILMDSNTETGSQCLKANKIGAVHITKTVTERKVYKASDDNANGFSEVTVAVPYTDVHYDKDDIVSFVGEDLPLKSVTAYIEPQQDLHGYDAPWVGGAGKNKYIGSPSFDGYTNINGWAKQTETLNGHEVYKRTGTWNGCYKLVNLPTGTYTFSAQVKTSDSGAVGLFLTNDSTTAVVAPTGNSVNSSTSWQKLSLTFNVTTAGTVAARIEKTTAGDIYISEFQLESGSTATTFAPYSNICPISGWDEVDVNVSGVNVWDEEWEVGGLNPLNGETTSENDRIRSKNYRPCKPNITMFYYIPSGKGNLQIVFYDINKNYLGYYNFTTEHTFTTPNGCCFFKFNTGGSYGTTYNNDISINYPSTDTEYHAYNGQTYTIDLDGTRYGGKLDVVSGVLTVDRELVDMGDLTWLNRRDIGQGLFSATLSTHYKQDVNVKCMCSNYAYKGVSEYAAYAYAKGDGSCSLYYGAGYTVYVVNASHASDTGAEFKNYIRGAKLVYELATPLTIQLSPTQVNSLMGVNNVWADTGEIAVEWQTLYVTPTT